MFETNLRHTQSVIDNHRRIFFLPRSESAEEYAPELPAEGTFEGVISMENNVDNLENIFN